MAYSMHHRMVKGMPRYLLDVAIRFKNQCKRVMVCLTQDVARCYLSIRCDVTTVSASTPTNIVNYSGRPFQNFSALGCFVDGAVMGAPRFWRCLPSPLNRAP